MEDNKEYKLPDSGERREFFTGAVRDANKGKGLPHLLPPTVLRKLAQHFEAGCQKYGKNNFMLGMDLAALYDSAFRHTLSWAEGKTDEPHLIAALWNLTVAAWTEEQIQNGKLPKELNNLPYRNDKITN